MLHMRLLQKWLLVLRLDVFEWLLVLRLLQKWLLVLRLDLFKWLLVLRLLQKWLLVLRLLQMTLCAGPKSPVRGFASIDKVNRQCQWRRRTEN